ncbi:hypothetical protein ACFQ7M_17570 [Streptomyces massasporeus]
MCRITAAGKEAAVARFLQEFPPAARAESDHSALRGCDDIAWADFPECPAGVPALLRGLLDPVAAREAERVLCIVLMDSPFSMGPEQAIRFLGSDRDHPERARCRAVFAEHADLVRGLLDDRTLPDGLIRPDERTSLLTVTTP